MSQQEQKKSAIERLELVEAGLDNINKVLESLTTSVGNIAKVAEAAAKVDYHASNNANKIEAIRSVVAELGKSQAAVAKVIQDKNLATSEELMLALQTVDAENIEAQEKDLLDAGTVKVSEESTEQSLLVVSQLNKDGKVATMRDFIQVAALSADIKPLFVGKKLGDKVELPSGSLTTILNVLEPVDTLASGGEGNA